MTGRELDPAVLARLRITIAAVLGALVLAVVVVMAGGFWPLPWVDELGRAWFGRTSLRWRFAGLIVVLGGWLLLPALLVVLLVVLAARRMARPPRP